MLIELIFRHHSSVIFAIQKWLDLAPIEINAEIQIAKEDLAVVIFDVVALILGASITFIRLLIDFIELLVSLIYINFGITAT